MLFQLFLGKLGELVLSKVMDKTTDKALTDLNNIKEFELILNTLHENLKLLSAKASDVEEEAKNGERSGRKKRKREVEEWLEQVKSIQVEVDVLGSEAESEGFVMRLMDGGKASRLNEQVEKLLQQRLDFGKPVLDAPGTREEILLTNGMVGEAFDENLETILKLLEDRQVSKIGVYGMGGIGKTMLAKHIHNRLVQRSQGRVFWITVSQEFTITSLQDKVARCLGIDLSNEDEEALRAGRLNRFLSQMKNLVLILDDVWEKIDILKVGCTFSVEFCRLIITTRSLDVCRQIGCKKLIPVVKLCKDEAWKLFNDTLENEIELDPQVEEIAKSMAEVCDGLPLGIITVAGSMKGETNIHKWRNALEELRNCVGGKDYMGEEVDEVFKVLKYSFNRLNRSCQSQSNEFNTLQSCFMYCSLYPEDYQIVIDDLVEKFISYGLLYQRKKWIAQVELGISILDKLVKVCLLESYVNHRNEECVKMHDLVRGMALKIGEGKYMVRAGDKSFLEIIDVEEWTEGLEKVSFMKSGLSRIGDRISPNCPNLSTLLLCENYKLKVIPESFFSKMQGLCTLDLCNTGIRMLPNSVFDLTCLKALLLEDCKNLVHVPYVGKLKALRELNLSGTAINKAPQGLDELHDIRFLSINAEDLKMLPRGVLLKLGHLQHLDLPLHIQVEIDEIENLKQLEEFNGGVKNVNDFNRFIATPKAHGTCCYRIGVRPTTTKALPLGFGMPNELVLCESNVKDEKVLGQGIVYLSIRECEGLSTCFVDDLQRRFDNPTSLKKLDMITCGGIEWILKSDGQGSQFTLEEIQLRYLGDLKGVVMEREIGPSTIVPTQPPVFSSLRKLFINNCHKMRKVGLPASEVPNLERIAISSCGEIEEVLEEDEGRAASILTTLPKLTYLRLHDLPRLKSVSKTTIMCNSISYIYIIKCPRLMNKLPLHTYVAPPPFLKNIIVEREWWESLEWDFNPNLPQLLRSILHFR